MATKKKTPKKRGKKASASAEPQQPKPIVRPPLLQAIFVLVELLLLPGPPSDDGMRVRGPERDRLEQRRRSLLARAFLRADRFAYSPNLDRVDLSNLREDIEDLLVGGRGAGQNTREREEAHALASSLVNRVFDLEQTKLASLMPETIKSLKAEADARRKAEEEVQRRRYAEAEKKRKEAWAAKEAKRRGGKKKAKRTTSPAASKKSPTKKTSDPSSKPAKRTTSAKKAAKSPTAAAPRGRAAKAEAAGQLPLGASAPATKPTPPPKPAPRTVPAARCIEVGSDGMRCRHEQGHTGDHETIAGDQW